MLKTLKTTCSKASSRSIDRKKSPFEGVFSISGGLALENGEHLSEVQLAYTVYGELNDKANNVVWVCHALTANANPVDWWSGLVGEACLFNPHEYCIVCCNLLGSAYGSTNPLSENPKTKKPWLQDFPLITVRDNITAFEKLRIYLGIEQIHTLIGGSLGGHQALEWAIMHPQRMQHLILCASSAKLTPWAVAFNQSQRLAIEADQSWQQGDASEGLKAARAIALLSYRNSKAYNQTQADTFSFDRPHRAQTYQDYQGEKLASRFNAFSYHCLTKTMDSHDVGRGRDSIAQALSRVKAKSLVIGIDSDVLFPIQDSVEIAAHIADVELVEISSEYGHDGFLLETGQIAKAIRRFGLMPLSCEQESEYSTSILQFGFGCVGAGFFNLLRESGKQNLVQQIVVKDAYKHKNLLPAADNVNDLSLIKSVEQLSWDEVNINAVVEAIDDSKAAYQIAKQAMSSGKHLITANKHMVAEHLSAIVQWQNDSGLCIRYEAAVAASIPILNVLDGCLDLSLSQQLWGIVNGSSNYILTQLHHSDLSYSEILCAAQANGFAESNPYLDLSGEDARHKAVILALHGFGLMIQPKHICQLGIQNISRQDIALAQTMGAVIKPLMRIEKGAENTIAIRVAPEFLANDDWMARIENENNALQWQCADTPLFFSGPGAGARATACALSSDLQAISEGKAYNYQINSDLWIDNDSSCVLYIRANNAPVPYLPGRVYAKTKDSMLIKTSHAHLISIQHTLAANCFCCVVADEMIEKCRLAMITAISSKHNN